MGMIKNVTEGIYPLRPYQQALYDKVKAGGFKPGEMFLVSAGRQTGKSYLNKMYGKLWNNNLCKEIMLTHPEPKYKFTRANWFVAEFDDRYYFEVEAWCSQQFGPHPARPDAWSRWFHKYENKIHFSNEKDYQWFLLKWGV